MSFVRDLLNNSGLFYVVLVVYFICINADINPKNEHDKHRVTTIRGTTCIIALCSHKPKI